MRWSPQAYADVLTGRRHPVRFHPARPVSKAPAPPRAVRLLTLAVGLLAALLVLSWNLPEHYGLTLPWGLREPEDSFSREASLALFQPQPLRYDLWYREDLRHLRSVFRLSPPARLRVWRSERDRLSSELARLDRQGPYADPRGFRVYSPAVTGRLHALALALKNRQDLLKGLPPARLPGPEAVATIGGYRLYPTLTRKFASREAVVKALRGLKLPAAAFSGYRVYLLPGSLGEVSGLGGAGYSLLAAEPLTERLVANQAASTATHEFGHHLSLSRLGGHLKEAPQGWGRYLKLRDIAAWREDGLVNTEDWARSPEETLAEDVRVLFGDAEAASLPYDSAYPDPRRNPVLRQQVEGFLRQLAAAAPRQPVDPSPAPWLDDLSAGLAALERPVPPSLLMRLTTLTSGLRVDGRRAFLAFLALVAGLSLVPVRRLGRRALRPAPRMVRGSPSSPPSLSRVC
ncbi:MAG: hypothetical protein ACM3UP_01395 [Methanocella sp.]